VLSEQPFKNRRRDTWGVTLHPESVSLRFMQAFSRAKWPILALFAALCAGAAYALPFSVDDAYITARYARRIAQGFGYTFNDGVVADGVTGPLWLLPLAGAARLGLDPIALSKLLGLLCVLLAGLACVVRARGRAQGELVSWATASFGGSSVPLCVWSVAGLETGAATLTFTCMALSATARGQPRPVALGIAIAGSAWLRPEMCLAAIASLVCAFIRDRKAAQLAFGIGACGAFSLLLFRYLTFGELLPLSVYAKPAELGHGIDYVFSTLRSVGTWLTLLLIGLSLRAGGREERMHVAILASHVFACVLSGGDWMPGLRLLAPLVPVCALCMAIGVRELYRVRPVGSRLLWGLTLLAGVLAMLRELPAVRAAGQNRPRQVEQLLAHLGPNPRSIAVLDIGALGYFSDARIIDLGGLVEPVIAHAAGGHMDKKIDQRWFAAQAPQFIILHSAIEPRLSRDGELRGLVGYPVEQRVARMPLVRATYRAIHVQRYGPRYFYVILAQTPTAARSQTSLQVKPERTAWGASERIDLGRRASLQVLAP